MEKISNWSDYDKMVKKELKGDVVRFEDTLVYRLQEDLDKQKTSVKYYVDILTDLKKWLEELYDYSDCMRIDTCLNKIKELEEMYHEK
jgi:hypothetical protein